MTAEGAAVIVFTHDQIALIEAEAERAYPHECCGLIAGREGENEKTLTATHIAPSANLRDDSPRDRFEVDPQARIDLMRDLRGTGERIVGFYHSHPDHPSAPSEHDLKMAFEPDLVWIITAVTKGKASETTAHRPAADGSRFLGVAIRIVP